MQSSVRTWQRRTIVLLWFTYISYYFGRLNLSIALPAIQESLQWTPADVGIIGGVFFWVYAVGQLINGTLGDRVPARLFVALGLAGSALLNLLFGFTVSLAAMAAVWGLNGLFQSTGWGPIVRTASVWTAPGQRGRVSAVLGTSFVLGGLASWYASGQILRITDHWPWVFWLPGIYLLFVAGLWYAGIRSHPADVGLSIDGGSRSQGESKPGLREFIAQTGSFLAQKTLALLALTTMFQGMVKEGINMWVPVLLVQTMDLPIADAALLSLFVPLMGFGGVLGASWLLQRLHSDERRTILWLSFFGIAVALSTAVSFYADSALLLAVFLGLCAALINGINMLLLSAIPMRFGRMGKASTLAGFLDFSSYIGAGLMALLTGVLASLVGWQAVVIAWAVLFALGWTSMYFNGNIAAAQTKLLGDT